MSVEVSDRFPGAEVRVMDFAVLSDTLDVSSWDAVVIISVKAHSPGAQQLGLVP
jgi:hypothetical protein